MKHYTDDDFTERREPSEPSGLFLALLALAFVAGWGCAMWVSQQP